MKIRHLPILGLTLCAATATWAATPAKQPAPPPPPATSSEQGRDWSRIDTNRDGLVSPEEMEKWLADNPGPLKK